MKKYLLILFSYVIISNISVNAEITVSETTDPEILINSGYSEAVAEDVFMLKNRATGQPCEPLYEKPYNKNKFIKCLQRFYAYIDPAQDSDERYHHDIRLSPSYTDL